jgi:hypothetical protein
MAVRAGKACAAVLALVNPARRPCARARASRSRRTKARFPRISIIRAVLAIGLLAGPVALMVPAGPAAAAATQGGTSLVSLAITSMTPQWAGPTGTVRLTGTLRNTSAQATTNLVVQLLGSKTQLTTLPELQPAAAEADELGLAQLPGAAWHTTGELAAGASVTWSLHVKASAIGMTAFGVYPLQVQVHDELGTPLASELTYLPFEPGKKSGYPRPAAQKVAWLWPLIDKPLLSEPWQNECQGAQAAQLASSLAGDGRLGSLVAAGSAQAGTAEAYTRQRLVGRSADGKIAGSQPAQSLAGDDGVTWAIDPALLDNVRALAACGSQRPQWSRTATAWLSELESATAGQPEFTTPYGDANLAALIAQGHARDISLAFKLGRDAAGQDLKRNFSPSQNAAAATAWPSTGTASFATVESLAASDGISSVVLAASDLPDASATVAKADDGGGSFGGGYVTLLLANDALSQLLQSPGTGPGGAFATSQEFLAETALLAQDDPGQPIIVAPPQRWSPPAGLASDLLADTAAAPWLSPVTLSSLAAARHLPTVPMPSTAAVHHYGKRELAQFSTLEGEINALAAIKAKTDPAPYEALFDIESSAWQGRSSVAKAMISQVAGGAHGLATQPQSVKIVAASRITLGGLKGSVPVSIDNGLDYAVRVKMLVRFSQASGLRVTKAPAFVTVPAHTDLPLHLHLQLAQSGSTAVTVSLLDQNGNPVATNSGRMTVQATQVGVLGMIIFAAALGVFLIASAGRAVRRGRPAPAADLPVAAPAARSGESEGGEQPAQPDTVMPERTELGTASTPGL